MYGVDLRIEFSEADQQDVFEIEKLVKKTYGDHWRFNRTEAVGDCLFAIFETTKFIG